jgi:hypothetical protein
MVCGAKAPSPGPERADLSPKGEVKGRKRRCGLFTSPFGGEVGPLGAG